MAWIGLDRTDRQYIDQSHRMEPFHLQMTTDRSEIAQTNTRLEIVHISRIFLSYSQSLSLSMPLTVPKQRFNRRTKRVFTKQLLENAFDQSACSI